MSEAQPVPSLFVHERRPEWGVAILADDRTTRRDYLFQDGRLRTFKSGFFHLLEPADKPLDVARRVARKLGAKVDKVIEKGRPRRRETEVSMADQCRIFRGLFPGGFRDPDYIKKFRGALGGRRRKSHADAAIAEARRLMDRERMAARSPEELHADAMALLDAVHFCKKRDKVLLKKMKPARRAEFGVAFRDLMHGEGPFFDRFARLQIPLETADSRPSWTMATVFSGLARPQEHIIVTPRAFDMQARWMAPTLPFDLAPTAGLYGRLQKMALNVRDTIEQREFNPRDLLDVHHFIVLTLRPKAVRALARRRAEAHLVTAAA